MEFVNLFVYTNEPVLLMETETANARRLDALDDAGVVAAVMSELRAMFPSAPDPIGHVVARLSELPFQRGAFSYMPVGGDPSLHGALSAPLFSSRLVLAGEHTSALHPGTVHGAIVSGQAAAAQVRGAACNRPYAGEDFARAYQARLAALEPSDAGQEGEGPPGAGAEWAWDRNP